MANTPRLGLALLSVAQSAKELTLNSWLNTASVGLDNAALVTIANTFGRAPDASTQHGNLNIGDGGFTGGAGHYAGAAGGTLLAINLVSGGTADLINLQVNGVSKWKMGSGGNATYGEGSNINTGTTTGSIIATTTSQKIAFYGATPIAQQAGTTDLRTGLLALGLFGATGAMPLNLNGGDLTANAANLSGAIKGSGTPVTFSRVQFTFPSDADATLDTTQRANLVIDVQAGTITATRSIIVPNTATGIYIVHNRNTQAVTLKVSGQTGITVAAGRAAWLSALGGTAMSRLSPDVDFTV
jgi:hypothetical protein